MQWWEEFKTVKNEENGTTEPFLSLFVHRSGLTPKVDKTSLEELSQSLNEMVVGPLNALFGRANQENRISADKVANLKKQPLQEQIDFLAGGPDTAVIQNAFEGLKKEVLSVPLAATKGPSYHRDIEKLAFSLKDSIILRDILQIWLAIEKGGELKPTKPPRICAPPSESGPVEGWDRGIFDERLLSVKVPIAGSTSCVSVIGRLNSTRIRDFYGAAILARLASQMRIKVPF